MRSLKDKHFNSSQRSTIEVLLSKNFSISKIAEILGKSTISREIKRGTVEQLNTYL